MARIRTLKPEFFQDEKLSPLPPLTRLVFVGLICMADDAGRLVDNLKLIDGVLFPATDDSAKQALETLARLSRILRYEDPGSGQRLIQIRNFSRHQKVDHPSSYVLPPPQGFEPPALANRKETLARSARKSRAPRAKSSRPYLVSSISDLGSSITGNDTPPTRVKVLND